MTSPNQAPAFEQTIAGHVRGFSGKAPNNSTVKKFWTGLSAAVMEQIADDWDRTRNAYKNHRRAAYFSAEFLQGRALLNNLTNLGLVDKAQAATEELGHNLTDVLEAEHDAALGNGGLGRSGGGGRDGRRGGGRAGQAGRGARPGVGRSGGGGCRLGERVLGGRGRPTRGEGERCGGEKRGSEAGAESGEPVRSVQVRSVHTCRG